LKGIPSIPFDLKLYFVLGFLFFACGWVLSDVLESIVFILKRKKHAKH
jgi:hypothetical protein